MKEGGGRRHVAQALMSRLGVPHQPRDIEALEQVQFNPFDLFADQLREREAVAAAQRDTSRTLPPALLPVALSV